MPSLENEVGIREPRGSRRPPGKEDCFAAAYEDGVRRLRSRVGDAAEKETGWAPRISAGLAAGLEFLAAEPSLAQLLLVESLAPARSSRREHERSLALLAEALRPPPDGRGRAMSEERARLLAGGLASYLSGRVLEGEAERLTDSHELLLAYLLSPPPPAMRLAADERAGA